MESELEPCPFCGGTSVVIEEYRDHIRDIVVDHCEDAYYDYENCFNESADGGYVVRCTSSITIGGVRRGCATTSGWCATRSEAVERWNTRAEITKRTSVVYKRKKDSLVN